MDLGDKELFQVILLHHQNRYPYWKMEDLYKLIHQSAMGNEHAIKNEVAVRDWMAHELVEMGEGPEEPLIDAISPDSAIVRVHLRSLVYAQLDAKQLLQAFLETPKLFSGLKQKMDVYMAGALELARDTIFPFSEAQLADFFEQMKALDFPAVHHSPEFERLYRPAYRVVARAGLPREFLADHFEEIDR